MAYTTYKATYTPVRTPTAHSLTENVTQNVSEYLSALFCLPQFVCFNTSGFNLASVVRSLLFKAFLRQDKAWYDREENCTGSLTSMLAVDALLVQGVSVSWSSVRLCQAVSDCVNGWTHLCYCQFMASESVKSVYDIKAGYWH